MTARKMTISLPEDLFKRVMDHRNRARDASRLIHVSTTSVVACLCLAGLNAIEAREAVARKAQG